MPDPDPAEDLGSAPLGHWLSELDASPAGLSGEEAARRLKRHGPNDAMARRRRSLLLQFLGRFGNPLVLVLLFASALSAVTGNVTSFLIIAVIVLLSVVLDFVQEVRAQNAVEALRRSVALQADTRRDGAWTVVPVERLVPGDVVHLGAGDIVPADGRLLESRDLFVNEALLTGEPYPAEKRPDDTAASAVFMGTSVISGTAVMLVCRTAARTALGGLAGTLATQRAADAFELGVRRFGLLILRLTVFLVLFVLAANVLFHRPWLDSLLFALALAVGLTPELLPMVVTVTLAGGAKRLAARRVIVKRLAAIHDLGAMDVLCTDKTGTLTEARIEVVRHIDARGATSDRVLELAYLNSFFESGIKSPLDDAILDRGKREVGRWRKLDEVPFDFERRRVSVLLERGEGGGRLLVVKGGPEDVLRLSTSVETEPGSVEPMGQAARQRLLGLFERLGDEGFRVLAVAWRNVGPDHATAVVTDEAELSFAGYVAFLDPPKAGAAAAIASLAASGVEVKILTGDNERVTRHVCGELGLEIGGVLTGDDLAALSDEALLARLRTVNLFCRVTPQQKRRVLLALKRLDLVTGFLGDGINDASALHAADVGISVDGAADVAKEAADLVLLEHDLAVVREGVLEGRRTVENVTKYIMMGSSSNFGNMFSMAGAALFLPFLPMQPIQVLLNNLLYDCSEMGVPLDHVDPESLAKPTRWNLPLIERFMLVMGPVSSLFDFLTFGALLYLFSASEALFQTGWFVESLATQTLVIFVIRTRRAPWRSRPHPLLGALAAGTALLGMVLPLTPLGPVFGFVAPPPVFYLFVVAAVLVYLMLVEAVKRAFYRLMARHPAYTR
ncbi:MAG TPA: magnesium-translocating P-type ATPase [Geminicoccaceae bacterium]|nr:magnesium-translocating P-type ATPase [Geminicoccaceae bacterium]